MSREQETIADIVAAMRKRKEMLESAIQSSPMCYSVESMAAQVEVIDEFADRIEAAWKLESKAIATENAVLPAVCISRAGAPVGNAAWMREREEIVSAVEELLKGMCPHCDMQDSCAEGEDGMSTTCNAMAKARDLIRKYKQQEEVDNGNPF